MRPRAMPRASERAATKSNDEGMLVPRRRHDGTSATEPEHLRRDERVGNTLSTKRNIDSYARRAELPLSKLTHKRAP